MNYITTALDMPNEWRAPVVSRTKANLNTTWEMGTQNPKTCFVWEKNGFFGSKFLPDVATSRWGRMEKKAGFRNGALGLFI